MTPLYENASDAGERQRGLHMSDRQEDDAIRPSRSSDIVYQIAAVATALILLATMV